MALPAYSPVGGAGSTYLDRSTGVTYRFDGRQWQPISSGNTPASFGPVGPAPAPRVAGATDTAGGGTDNPGGSNGGGQPSQGGGINPTSYFEEQIRLAREAADEGHRRADFEYGRAQDVYNQGLSTIGRRRGEFNEDYGRARNDILTNYEGSRGDLQRASQESGSRLRSGLRALGLGGSALLKGVGRQRQQEARSLGDVNIQRGQRDQAAQENLDKNLGFLSEQESALNRYLQGAQEARRQAGVQAGLAERGDVNAIQSNIANIVSQLLANQQALNAANGSISGYTSNPYLTDINTTLSGLNSLIPQAQAQSQNVQAGNIAQDPTLAAQIDPRRAGIFGAGLYA